MAGPTLVLVSSLGCDSRIWFDVLRALGLDAAPVDLPGHGTSPRDPEAWSVSAFGRSLASQVSDVGRHTICGVGLGAAVAVEAVAARPDRYSHLILVSSRRTMPGQPWMERADMALTAGDMAALADDMVDRWLTEPSKHRSPDLVAMLRQMISGVSVAAYAQGCRATANLDLTSALANVTVPTLVVAGTSDEATPPSAADDVAAHLVSAQRVDLLDAAHMIPAERPRELARLMKEFIE